MAMLSVYIDNSGSMGEMDKIEVAKYLARSIKNADFYLLNGKQIDLDLIALDNDKALHIKACGIKILLSDGLFNGGKEIFDIALAIGIDADIRALKEMATKVYSLEETGAFLEHINSLLPSDEGNSWE